MNNRFFILDKKTNIEIEVSYNIFMACFGEIPENKYKLENDYIVGRVE